MSMPENYRAELYRSIFGDSAYNLSFLPTTEEVAEERVLRSLIDELQIPPKQKMMIEYSLNKVISNYLTKISKATEAGIEIGLELSRGLPENNEGEENTE